MRHAPGILCAITLSACNAVGGGGSGTIYWNDSVDFAVHKLDLGSGADLVIGEGDAAIHTDDGQFIYVAGDLRETDERWVQSRTIVASNTDQELSNNGFKNPQLSPDGTKIAYSTLDDLTFVVNRADGAVVARLLPEGGISAAFLRPTWTPDGRLVLGGGYGNKGLFITDAALANPTRFDPGLDDPRYPAVSPDGTKVVCVVGPKLWVLNLDGTGLLEIHRDDYELRYPTWSPDGTRIAFYSSGRMKIVPATGGDALDLFERFPALGDRILVFGTSAQFDWE